jgi:hypothetical protein
LVKRSECSAKALEGIIEVSWSEKNHTKTMKFRGTGLPRRGSSLAAMINDAVGRWHAGEPGSRIASSWWGNKAAPSGLGSYLLKEGMASFSGMAFFETVYGRERAVEEHTVSIVNGIRIPGTDPRTNRRADGE